MTAKTSTIKDIISKRPYDGQNGRIWYFDILLDNGDHGSIGKKSEDGLWVGQTLTYTAEEGKFGLRLKEYREPYNGGSNGNSAPKVPAYAGGARHADGDRNRSFALAYAKDITVAIAAGKGIDSEAAANRTIEIADKFLAWLNAEK